MNGWKHNDTLSYSFKRKYTLMWFMLFSWLKWERNRKGGGKGGGRIEEEEGKGEEGENWEWNEYGHFDSSLSM